MPNTAATFKTNGLDVMGKPLMTKTAKQIAKLKLRVGQLEALLLNTQTALKASQIAHKQTKRSVSALRGVITKLKQAIST